MSHNQPSRSGIDHIGVAVSFIVWDGETSVLVHRRGPACRDERGRWDTGSGEVEFGEDPRDAAPREVGQEYGIQADEVRETTLLHTRSVVRPAAEDTPRSHWVTFLYLLRVDRRPIVVPVPERERVEHPAWINPLSAPLFLPLHSQTSTHLSLFCESLTLPQRSRMQQAAHSERSEWFLRYYNRLPTPDQREIMESLIIP